MGAIGYYCTDFITPIVGSLVRELQEDAHIICSAVDIAFSSLENKHKNNSNNGGGVVVYALTTHPGHHASRDCFGGYCYLNNAALCARLMQRRLETGQKIINEDGTIASNHWSDDERNNSQQGKTTNKKNNCRIAIIDIDYHCGNGTASIFYQDPTIFFTSIHCDPTIEYPWNSGYNDQIGAGEGMGTTLHIPLPPGTTWEGSYKLALENAMHAIVQFDPAALVISLGLDTYEGDSVAVKRGGFCLKGGDYYEMGRCMGTILRRAGTDGISSSSSNIPCVFVQEGGYKMDTVGDAAADVVGGFAASISQQGSPL